MDETHDPTRTSWVTSANGHRDFPIQNLPIGVFSPPGGAARAGVAIGEQIVDLDDLLSAGVLHDQTRLAARAATGGALGDLLALGAGPRQALRQFLSDGLRQGAADQATLAAALHCAADCTMHLPARIGDYTDFFVGIHHAAHTGALLRPGAPLLPNYKHLPIGYHGRASSIRPSGVPVRRPQGQTKPGQATQPLHGPSRRLDFELELAVWVGPGTLLGETIPIERAPDHIAGFCLLNDWSARDIQLWESQPLGPFLGKSFATTISPWIVTPEALAPFRAPASARPPGDPKPLDYLWGATDQASGGLDVALEVFLQTQAMRERHLPPHRMTLSHTRHMYWTVAQMLVHHASGGCDMRPGDLLGSGTLSGPEPGEAGCLLEATAAGREPLRLPGGEIRRFLEDGDEVILRAQARRDGAVPIGFGDCRAMVLPASNAL